MIMYCLINEQECFIRFNGFKHDYKFNRYTALLAGILYHTNEDTTTIETALSVFFI